MGWAQGARSTGRGAGSQSSLQSQRRPGPREGEQLADVYGRSEQALARLKENRNTQESSPQRLELKTFIMSVPGGQSVLVCLFKEAVSQRLHSSVWGHQKVPDAFPCQESGPRAQ